MITGILHLLFCNVAAHGLFNGVIVSNMYTSCAEVLEGHHAPALYSVFLVGLGVGSLIGAPISGG